MTRPKPIGHRRSILAACALAGLAMPALSPAETTAELKAALAARIAAIEQDPNAREEAIRNGREHATFCAYCHGPDGNSAKPEIPHLAGQNGVYLLDQIERFADKRRQDYTGVMQQLAARFTAEEKLALVVYYASVPLKPASGDLDLARKGLPLYVKYCQSCHGSDGRGSAGYARVAGQQPQYLIRTLKDFRDGKAQRLSPGMTTASAGLDDAQIAAIAAYVATLR